MKKTKQLGIWMDHSIAHIMEFNKKDMLTATIIAKVGEQDEALNTLDESMIQNKEQNQLSDFFKRLSQVIIDFDEVLLFGPTNAKVELFNHIKSDHHFDKIKIVTSSADKMTENQMEAFVKEHFENFKKNAI